MSVSACASTSAYAAVIPKANPPAASSLQKNAIQENTVASTENQSAQDQKKIQDQQILEQQSVDRLQARDREVRAHELAHASIGGIHAGTPHYDFTRGADGVNYAVGGEVSIDVSPVPGNPQATIEKARVIRAAALAPAQPSSQDRRVAAKAMQMAAKAQAEISQELSSISTSPALSIHV